MKRNKSCFNCCNAAICAGSDDTRDCPGDAPMAECRLAMTPAGRVVDSVLFELGEANEWHEEIMPEKCGHYVPLLHEKCAHCGCTMNSPEFSHEFYAYDFCSGESAPVCSEKCNLAYNYKSEREYMKSQEGMDVLRDEPPINVMLECSKEFVNEMQVKFVDISEDFSGRDVLLFECPVCKEQHSSLRYG